MNSEASQRGLPHESTVAHQTRVAARAFLPVLRRLDRDLTLPVPDRLRILRELEFDLEELCDRLEARGMSAEDARNRAVDALMPDGATLRELDRLHAPHYRRLTRHFRPGRLRILERSALALITTAVLFTETIVLLRADWLRSPPPFLWPVLGLGALLFAAIAAQLFKLWVKHDHRDLERNFRIILWLSGLTLATGIFGALIDFFRLAEALEAEPGLAGSLLPEWLVGSCVLLSFSLLLGHHPSGSLASVRTSTSRGAAGGARQMPDPVPVHHPGSMGEIP